MAVNVQAPSILGGVGDVGGVVGAVGVLGVPVELPVVLADGGPPPQAARITQSKRTTIRLFIVFYSRR